MKLSRKDVDHLSTLAHLALSDEEAARFETQISAVLDYVGKIAEAPRTDASLTGSDAVNVLREDRVREATPGTRDRIIANFPSKEGDLLSVPAVFGEK
jgi:aspartyl-tRNA(Asn)/glutamyl-tRNA(Gln) amidotransferase subunit C